MATPHDPQHARDPEPDLQADPPEGPSPHPYADFYALPDADRLSAIKDKPRKTSMTRLPDMPASVGTPVAPAVPLFVDDAPARGTSAPVLSGPPSEPEGDAGAAADVVHDEGEAPTAPKQKRARRAPRWRALLRPVLVAVAVTALIGAMLGWRSLSQSDSDDPSADDGVSGFEDLDPGSTSGSDDEPVNPVDEAEGEYADALEAVTDAADLPALRKAGKKAAAAQRRLKSIAAEADPQMLRKVQPYLLTEYNSLGALSALAKLPAEPLDDFAPIARRLKATASAVSAERKTLAGDLRPSDPTTPATATFQFVDVVGASLAGVQAQQVAAQLNALTKAKSLTAVATVGTEAQAAIPDAQDLLAGFVVKSSSRRTASTVLDVLRGLATLTRLSETDVSAWASISPQLRIVLSSATVPQTDAIVTGIGALVTAQQRNESLGAYFKAMGPVFSGYANAFGAVPDITGQQVGTSAILGQFDRAASSLRSVSTLLSGVGPVPASMLSAHRAVVALVMDGTDAATNGATAARSSVSCRGQGSDCFLANQSGWSTYLSGMRSGGRLSQVQLQWSDALNRAMGS